MQFLAVRPYATAGMALTCAGAIAVTPLAAPVVQVAAARAVHAAVDLTAFDGHLVSWAELLENTSSNLQGLGQMFSANPFPILTQVIANQEAFAENFDQALQNFLQFTQSYFFDPDYANGFIDRMAEVSDLLNDGQIYGAVDTFSFAFESWGLALTRVIGPLFDWISGTADNQASIVDTFFSGLTSFVYPASLVPPLLNAPLEGMGVALQKIADAVNAGNLSDLATALWDFQPTVLDAQFNGIPLYHFDDGQQLAGSVGFLGSHAFPGPDSMNFHGGLWNIFNFVVLRAAESIGYTANPVPDAASAAAASGLGDGSSLGGLGDGSDFFTQLGAQFSDVFNDAVGGLLTDLGLGDLLP